MSMFWLFFLVNTNQQLNWLLITAIFTQACADKLKNEMAAFGNPPRFPNPEEEINTNALDQKKVSLQLLLYFTICLSGIHETSLSNFFVKV